MPEKKTIERARQDAREGKAPSTQAGEFVREEIEHIREGKHGARSTKQAIAIGLSKARRAGVKLSPPKKGKASEETRTQAKRNYAQGELLNDGVSVSYFSHSTFSVDEGPPKRSRKYRRQARSWRDNFALPFAVNREKRQIRNQAGTSRVGRDGRVSQVACEFANRSQASPCALSTHLGRIFEGSR